MHETIPAPWRGTAAAWCSDGKTDLKSGAKWKKGKLSTALATGAKEKGREKETFPPAPPKEKKGREKKQARVSFETCFKPARARTCAKKRRLPCTCSYDEAGDAADEIVGSCFGDRHDLGLWAWYCRHFDRNAIVEKAHEYASMQRQGEVRDAITAFQSWLGKTYKGNPPKRLYARSTAAALAKEGGAR